MYILVLDPQRLGHLDVLIPIAFQLKKENPSINFEVLYIDGEQFEILKKNRFLDDAVASIGQAVLLGTIGSKGSVLKKIVVGLRLAKYILKILCSKRVIFFQWKSLDSTVSRLICRAASLKGKSLTYQPMNNHYIEELRRYFDQYGHPRDDDLARELWLRQFKKPINPGDGALVNSVDSVNYFALMGYSNFHIIGYTHLYPEYVSYLEEHYRSYLETEIPKELLDNRACFGIFVNKFWGRWAGRSDDWFIERFCEVIETLRSLSNNPLIIVRSHPTLRTDVIQKAQVRTGYKDIFVTYLHPAIIGKHSKAVIGITESTSYHYVLGVGTAYIDYGGMRAENYEIFPEGSLNASYGTIAAKGQKELREALLDEDRLEEAIKNYEHLIKHRMNLSVFK